MIKLNKSHSKGDLVEIFKSLGVAIDKKLTKSIIVNNICDYIEKAQYTLSKNIFDEETRTDE